MEVIEKILNLDMPVIPERYYTGYELLRQLDANEKNSKIFMSNTNRTAGKTTFFELILLEYARRWKRKFCIIVREKMEIEAPESFFDNVLDYYYPESLMHSKYVIKNTINEIFLDNISVGYCVSLKDVVKLKKYSSVFREVDMALFDEVQPEDGKYVSDEVNKLISLISSISRGGGEQARTVLLFMLSNNISVMNPYFLNLEIYKKLPAHVTETAQYVKGDGYVCEFLFNKYAAEEMKEKSTALVFESRYNLMNVTAEFMINCNSFIEEKIPGKSTYLFTLKYESEHMAVRRMNNSGIIYVTNTWDKSFKTVIALTELDHDELTLQLRRSTFYMQVLRDSYATGKLRFSNLQIKDRIIKLLGVDYYRSKM